MRVALLAGTQLASIPIPSSMTGSSVKLSRLVASTHRHLLEKLGGVPRADEADCHAGPDWPGSFTQDHARDLASFGA